MGSSRGALVQRSSAVTAASIGKVEIEHYYPLPAGVEDPQRWLADHGGPLPFRRWL